MFGTHGEGPTTYGILDKIFEFQSSFSQETKDLLTAYKRVDNPIPVQNTPSPTIVETYLNFKQSWKLRKEKLTYVKII